MKKIFIPLALCLGIVSYGQTRFGVKTGLHVSNLGGSDLRETDFALNFHIGVLADIPLSKSPFHIQGEVLYMPLGYSNSNIEAVDNDGSSLGQIEKHRISYIEVPLSFLYKMKTTKVTYKMGIGPVFNFKTGDRMTTEGGEKFGNGSALPAYTHKINSTLAGIGIILNVEWAHFFASLQSRYSLSDVYKNNNSSIGPSWKIATAGISVGYFFGK